MNKEHKLRSRHQKLLTSFYEKQNPPTQSPDTRSLGKEVHKKSGEKRFGYHLSLPKAEPFPKQHHQQAIVSIISPKTARNSYSPKGLVLNIRSRNDETRLSTQKTDSIHNGNRYQQADLKIAVERQKKLHTSPRAADETSSPKKGEETVKIIDKQIFGRDRKEGSAFDVETLLTAEEYGKFGERFPEKFKRMGLLGRGGFSVVWLGVHKSSRKRVAVKQILSKNPHETHLKQIWFCSYFFQKGGQPRVQFKDVVGISNICKLYTYEIQKQDAWLYYELCDQSLGSSLFDLKGQTVNGQRVYRIEYGDLLYLMRSDQRELTKVVIEVSKALTLLNSHNIVHSDLKTENIMLKTRRGEPLTHEQSYIRSVKLIDFGSCFLFTNLRQFSMATPQYMPPEILNYILFQNNMEYDKAMLEKMSEYKNPWTIDMWSLGCIVLEIVSGVPLWMSAKTRTPENEMVTGLFAVKNRVFNRIVQKQIEVVQQLDFHLRENNHSGIVLGQKLTIALKGMLCLQPMKRISPWQLLTMLGVECSRPVIPSF